MTSASERYTGERRILSDRRRRTRTTTKDRRAILERRQTRLPGLDLAPLLAPLGFVVFFLVLIGFLMLMGAMD